MWLFLPKFPIEILAYYTLANSSIYRDEMPEEFVAEK
jgi:hypothetical protein